MSRMRRAVCCALLLAAVDAPLALAQQPGPLQVLFAGRLIDGVPQDAQRVAPLAMSKKLIYGPLPMVPATWLSHWGSLVQVLVVVDPKGSVINVLATDGPADLAAAASSAVMQWTFHPTGVNSVVTTIPLLFEPAVSGSQARVLYIPVLVRIASTTLEAHNTHKVMPARGQGTVTLHILVDPHGNVAASDLMSGPPSQREAWESALIEWRYRPYVLNGEPVWVDSTVTVTF